MKGFGIGKKRHQHNICFLAFQLIQTDEDFKVNGRTHTTTHPPNHPHTHTHTPKIIRLLHLTL